MGEMLHLTDIPMPKGVEIVALTHVEEGEDILHSDYNSAVLAVVKPRAEEVIEDEAPEAPDSDEDGEDGSADDGDAAEGDASDDD
jgi:hypothetical protein